VGAVAQGISVSTTESAETKGNTASELRVGADYTTVNDIGICAGTSRSIVDVAG
jgi:hypothetical protein